MAEETAARELLDDARALIETDEWNKLIVLITSLHPADLLELVLLLDTSSRPELLKRLPPMMVGQMFEYAEGGDLEQLAESTNPVLLPAALAELDDDVVADVLRTLDPEQREAALRALRRDDDIESLLSYGEESAGGIMSRGFVALYEALTVQQAIDYLRTAKPSSTQTYYLFIVDAAQRLVGNISIRDLLVSDADTPLSEITKREIYSVTTETDQEEAARLLQKYNLMAVPVVDDDGRLLGVTLADDLIDVVQEEATEDMYRMAGIDTEERVFSPVRTSVRRRLPWLLINTVAAFLGALMVSLFDETLAQVTLLAFFMPVVAGQGGSAGAQTATIAVRSIALGDLGVPDLMRACRKEIVVGLANGVAVAALAMLVTYAWQGNAMLALVLGAALLLTVTVATVNGILIPLGLKAARIDPALATNIIVTMTTDILGFFFFLGLAALVADRMV